MLQRNGFFYFSYYYILMNILFSIFIMILLYAIVNLFLTIKEETILFLQRMAILETLKSNIIEKTKIQSDKLKLADELNLQIKQTNAILIKKTVKLNFALFKILFKNK